MTRLFLRFYLGVIVILVAAWLIQSSVFRQSTAEENVPVIERVFASSGRMARDRIVAGGEERFEETMDYLESRFDYPIQVVNRTDRPMSADLSERLDRGESVLYFDRVETAIPDSQFLVEMGPLPRFDEPSQTELSFALGGVFSLTAIGIAFLLRPVIVQLRVVEKAALAIADGDLSARIDAGRFRHSTKLAGAFNSMADRIESLLRSQRELLQTVSHELRTPLARIKFATELLDSAESDQERTQRLASIDAATDRLDELVGELLTYVRLEAATDSPMTESIETRPFVDELIQFHAPLHPEIEYSSQLSHDTHAFTGDPNALSRALGNLITNAGNHAKSRVEISVTESPQQIHFVVEDDGPGIAEQDRDVVFEPFKRLGTEASAENGNSGTGLGLALVKRIAQRSGGDVTVDEGKWGGAKFQLSIPSNRS